MKNHFIVIEGLDGSGKSTAARRLAQVLENERQAKVLHTYEPHNDSCAGDYIRKVLRKEIPFSPRTLALAYAANRLDHCDRIINPWLDGDSHRYLICDRYYLSSLVYQSSPEFPMHNVMALNELARKPDVIFFLDASERTCFERLKIRNIPEELFEKDFNETRQKYLAAIDFLRHERQENIVVISADGTPEQVVAQILSFLK